LLQFYRFGISPVVLEARHCNSSFKLLENKEHDCNYDYDNFLTLFFFEASILSTEQ
ncbi:1445_t:CDS:2, partial [Acaulospora morrowiae]